GRMLMPYSDSSRYGSGIRRSELACRPFGIDRDRWLEIGIALAQILFTPRLTILMMEDPHPALIEPPDSPLSGLRLLRTVAENPIKAWPRQVYREDLYRSHRFGQDTMFVMAPGLIRTVLLDDADNFEKGEVA